MNRSIIRPTTTEDVARAKRFNHHPKRPPSSPPPPANSLTNSTNVKRARPSPPAEDPPSPTQDESKPQPYGTLNVAPDWLGNELPSSQPPGSTQQMHYPSSTAPQHSIFPSTAQMYAKAPGTRSLAHPRWGLSREIVLGLSSLGITSMYEWQEQCLSLPGVLEGERNVVYTAPTSAGKSLVADLLLIKKVVTEKKKAIIVLPYIAIVQEKTRFLKKALERVKLEVSHPNATRRTWRDLNIIGYHSGVKERGDWSVLDIAVCTIEKANAIINAAVEDRTIDKLGIVVFDELHMLADEHRGFILELLATKLLCVQEVGIQLVSMSATLQNVNQLAEWLKAHAFECKDRPIPLEEHLVYDNAVFDYEGNFERNILESQSKELKDSVKNATITLAIDCIKDGHGVLVFCESRAKCEAVAVLLAGLMPEVDEEMAEARIEVVRSLAASPTGLDVELQKTVSNGAAFHHAGLTTEERDLVAEAYDSGVIKVICCTATIAAGVNLPARRVIVSPKLGTGFVSPTMLRQMRGRAGRKGKDTVGESYICCRKEDLSIVTELMSAEMPHVASSLGTNNHGLTRGLLEIIATRLATTTSAIDTYFQSTLFYHVHPSPPELPALLEAALSTLKSSGLITSSSGTWEATKCGRATVAAGLSPPDGLFLHAELGAALRSFNLETDMHIVYQSTAIHSTTQPFDLDWKLLRDEFERLDEPSLRAAGAIGLKPAFIHKMAQGATFKPTTPEQENTLRVHRRFYLSLMLRRLINEHPVHRVANAFGIARGFVQSLSTSSRGFASMSAAFCRVMDWTGLAVLLEHYAGRLGMGVRDDLIALAKIPFVKDATARVFWDSGLKNVEAVAQADTEEVMELLAKAIPKRIKETEWEWQMLRGKYRERAEIVVNAAKRLREQETVVVLEE